MSFNLVLGGVEIPETASFDLSQTYFDIGPQAIIRFMDGSSEMQSTYSKLGTRISGVGWLASGLDGLDYTAPMMLGCIAARSISDAGLVIDLPSARRSEPEFVPRGYATVNGGLIETDLAIVSDEATLTAVTGATGYRVDYYPYIQVRVLRPEMDMDARTPRYRWALTAEEV